MPSATETQPQVNPWIVAVAVMCATFMEVLDTTVVNVSLPHIAGSLSVSTDEAAWALTSYLVANAIILPMTGWIASYFGRKRTLLAAVFGFTAASFLCGLATSLPMLIFFRVVQGATGGALQPLSQAVMLEAFPPRERGKAMAFWGLGIVVAPMLGPVTSIEAEMSSLAGRPAEIERMMESSCTFAERSARSAHCRMAASAWARSITLPAFIPRATVWPNPRTETA